MVTITSQTAALYPLFVRIKRCPMMPLIVPAHRGTHLVPLVGGKRSIRRFMVSVASRVERGENQVAGLGRREGHLGAFGVPDLPYEYHVGVLPQDAPQGPQREAVSEPTSRWFMMLLSSL